MSNHKSNEIPLNNIFATGTDMGISVPASGKVKKFFDLDTLSAPRPKPYARSKRVTKSMSIEEISDSFILSSKFYPLLNPSRIPLPLKRAEARTGFRFLFRKWWAIVQFDKKIASSMEGLKNLPIHAIILGNGEGGKRGVAELHQRLKEYQEEDPDHGYEIIPGYRIWRIK